MDFTDINDAYAVRVNPLGATPVGDSASGSPVAAVSPTGPAPPAVQTSPESVVILPPISSAPSTVPVYPETVVTNALQAQQASSAHGQYAGSQPAYIEAAQMNPPVVDLEPGYFERMGLRRRDLMKLVVLAVMVTLGVSLHWVGSHYVCEWIESSDFDPRQRLAIRLAYPAGVAFLLWNLKAFQ